MSILVCGVQRGTGKKYRCRCCGFEGDNSEAFATSACWRCAFGMNLGCANCVEFGVPVHSFKSKRTKMHRLRFPLINKGQRADTACGLQIEHDDIGGAIAVITVDCKRCWPEKGPLR